MFDICTFVTENLTDLPNWIPGKNKTSPYVVIVALVAYWIIQLLITRRDIARKKFDLSKKMETVEDWELFFDHMRDWEGTAIMDWMRRRVTRKYEHKQMCN
eukprot:UN07502